MSFTATFSNALSGIAASTLRAELLSFNIANAQTPDYARRAVNFEAIVPGGVRPTGIERVDAGRAELDLLSADNRSAGADLRSAALLRINESFGEPGNADGLYAVFTRFEQSISDLRLTPESGAAQTAMLRAAQDVAETFVQLEAETQRLRLDADRAIGNAVNQINQSLESLQELNAEARRPRGVGITTVAERQRGIVRELSQQIDIDVQGSYGGELTIRTRGGYLLVGEEASQLEFTPTGSISSGLSYAAGDLSGIFVNGREVTPGLVQGLGEGALAAQFAIRDSLAPDFTTRLDAAARDLVSRTTLPSSPVINGGLFVLAPGTTSAADRIAVNAAVDPAQGGELYRLRDGVGATAPGPEGGDGVLGELQDALEEGRVLTAATKNASAYSFRDMLGAVSTGLGTQALRGEDLKIAAEQSRDALDTEVSRLTAVDTDRELQDLILVEQAFAANARVIQVADDMLRQLLEF